MACVRVCMVGLWLCGRCFGQEVAPLSLRCGAVGQITGSAAYASSEAEAWPKGAPRFPQQPHCRSSSSVVACLTRTPTHPRHPTH